jgi:hypothetical protein
MSLHCKKCPYFGKSDDTLKKGAVVVGFCRLRQKFITDVSLSGPVCKDRAVLDL